MAQQFADFTWPPRWNSAHVVGGLSQAGPEVMAAGFFGTVRFRLDDDASVAAIISHVRAFADMVERTKREFDGTCNRCGLLPAPRWSTEICADCDPVRLCQGCFDAHKAEVAADQADDALSRG